ncbi:hypothetical protein ACWKSP_26185 [Micromonosporaceae bacterium Da 78-11]
MNQPYNDRYERRFTDPNTWPSNAFGHHAVEATRRRVNELSWELAGNQVAGEASAFLKAEQARRDRQQAAQGVERSGDPGE